MARRGTVEGVAARAGTTVTRRWPVRLAATAAIALGLTAALHSARSGKAVEGFDRTGGQAPVQLEEAGPDARAVDHELRGRWRVDYDEEWFKGSLIYDLREEDDGLRGYLVEMGDDSGSMPVSDEPLVFELRTWDGTKGTARYSMEYEGVDYETDCDIELLSTDRLRLRYSYYGVAGEEIWTRVEGGDPLAPPAGPASAEGT